MYVWLGPACMCVSVSLEREESVHEGWQRGEGTGRVKCKGEGPGSVVQGVRCEQGGSRGFSRCEQRGAVSWFKV